MRAPWRSSAGVAAFCLAAAPVMAQTVVFSSPSLHETLAAGSIVEIRWRGVPADADEVELLLSLDGGRHAAIRLTDELSSNDSSYVWRVPNLSTDHAALILRMGVAGEEIEASTSSPFEIFDDRSQAGQVFSFHLGELWVASPEAAPPGDGPDPAAGLTSGESWTASGAGWAAFDAPSTTFGLVAPRSFRKFFAGDRAGLGGRFRSSFSPLRPSAPPLRI